MQNHPWRFVVAWTLFVLALMIFALDTVRILSLLDLDSVLHILGCQYVNFTEILVYANDPVLGPMCYQTGFSVAPTTINRSVLQYKACIVEFTEKCAYFCQTCVIYQLAEGINSYIDIARSGHGVLNGRYRVGGNCAHCHHDQNNPSSPASILSWNQGYVEPYSTQRWSVPRSLVTMIVLTGFSMKAACFSC